MLYDNAQLLRLYAEAYATTKDPVYRAVAFDVGQYLRRDMMARRAASTPPSIPR